MCVRAVCDYPRALGDGRAVCTRASDVMCTSCRPSNSRRPLFGSRRQQEAAGMGGGHVSRRKEALDTAKEYCDEIETGRRDCW
jgi:hypothetical protein